MRLDRSVEGDHTTIFRWTQACAAELEKRIRPHLRRSNGSLRVDERYEKVKGRWVPVSSDRQLWPDDRLSSLRQARCGGGEAVLPQGVGATTQDKPAHHHRGQERGLSESHGGDEAGWRAVAPVTAATGEMSEQYRRARPSERETADPSQSRLRWFLGGPINTGRPRGDGNDEEGAGSNHWRQRQPGPVGVHRRVVSSHRLRDELSPLAESCEPTPTVATDPARPIPVALAVVRPLHPPMHADDWPSEQFCRYSHGCTRRAGGEAVEACGRMAYRGGRVATRVGLATTR
jgi:hypothetical protein